MAYTLELDPGIERSLKHRAEREQISMQALLEQIVVEAAGGPTADMTEDVLPPEEVERRIASMERGEGRPLKDVLREMYAARGWKVPDERA